MADGTPNLPNNLTRGRDQASDKTLILKLTARIVSAHLASTGNKIRDDELPGLIRAVLVSLAQVDAASSGPTSPGHLVPAVPPGRSVFPDYIICLEDGRRFRTLRRHLMAAFGFTPEQYRRRWSLPHDYPMIAPSYARNRSRVAKAAGLGRRTPAGESNRKHATSQST